MPKRLLFCLWEIRESIVVDSTGAVPRGAMMSAGKTRVMLWTLLVVYILNFLDRQIVTILAEGIKADLHLSDTQIGLMTGLAFALFYTFLGLPIARYADRPGSNRVGLISIALAVWSAMTALCGVAQNYTQLLLARIGVGVGEAGCTPAAHSLISDSVPADKRSSAMSFYGLGIPIGALLGMIIGGWMAENFGWRYAFFAVGAPGVLLALIVPLLIKDPRKMAGYVDQHAGNRSDMGAAIKELVASPCFWMIAIASSVTAFLGYGKGVWVVILFQRSHGLSPAETGLLLGVVLGIAGMIGTYMGGWLADRYGRQNPGNVLSAPAIGMAIAAPILFLGYLATEWHLAIALLTLPAIFNAFYYGPTFAATHSIVSPQARATASAVLIFLQNLIGLGLGPLFFGMLSDLFQPHAGTDSVRWVLYGAAWLGLIPALFYWLASRRLAGEIKERQEAEIFG
jgi:MFS family permease